MIRQLSDSELTDASRGLCPVCYNRGFVIGPQGGLSINVECADLDCRARFNIVWRSGQALWGEVIEKDGLEGGSRWPSTPID
jgi:hypothetical protein